MTSFLRYSKSIGLFILTSLLIGLLAACTSGTEVADIDEFVQQTVAARDVASTQTALTVTQTAVIQSTTDAASVTTAATATAIAQQTISALTNEATKNAEDAANNAENAANNNATATAVSQLATSTAMENIAAQQTAVALAAAQSATQAAIQPTIVPTPRYLLDSTLPPVHQITTLATGFVPDPHQVYAVAGGTADAGSRNLGYDCIGYVERAPDYRVNWTGNQGELTFAFTANDPNADTTLIINDQNLSWFCNDDADGRNPRVVIPQSVNGQYDIWIGSLNGVSYDGLLSVTELDNTPSTSPTGSLSPLSIPNFGDISLATGFTPDPYAVEVTSGGYVDVSAQNIGFDCTGFATEAPDYRLNWAGGSSELVIYFSSAIGEDPTLIINDPFGNWYCNDDYATSENPQDPAIFYSAAPSGQYDIWIGSYSAADNIAGQLSFAER